MSKDLLEIILITYNRKSKLEETFNQIFALNSPIKDFAITILDNTSTDGTRELIQEYVGKFPNIKHVRHNKNIGGNGNIARAIEISSKKYFWILCDDDVFDWTNWDEIEGAINEGYDVIFTRKIENNIADIFYSATFAPACIYKTENVTSTVMVNVLDNIRNLFPHLALIAANINYDKKIFIPSFDIVSVGLNTDGLSTYIRGLQADDIPAQRRYMFWAIGYFNSIELIKDRFKQIEIINNLRHGRPSLFDFFKVKIGLNLLSYNDFSFNLNQIFRVLSIGQKFIFILAYLYVQMQYLPCNNFDYVSIQGREKWEAYFEFINQERHLKKLAKKFKNKKIVIYGAGLISEVLFQSYDMSRFNIVAVVDKRFKTNEKSTYCGYPAISSEDVINCEFDVMFVNLIHSNIIKEYLNKLKTKKNFKVVNVVNQKISVPI